MVLSREDLHNMINMDVLQIILVIFMAGALGAVIIGIIAMAINGKLNKKHSNKLMRLRVLFQAIVVLIFIIIIWFSRN
jgi:NADH:ubiquinone oxidoreductase subunit 6 (subunit J)